MNIQVHTDTKDYEIVLEKGSLDRLESLLDLDRKVLVVSDEGVPREYSKKVEAAAKTPVFVALKGGENHKNLASFEILLKTMLENGFSRGDCVVAVGGGVVGDIGAFAASCYMRGIDFYNIPTTLLSQVDSSIGGKTGVNFSGVKNVVGSFFQPNKVIIDTDVLKTLDERQIRSGLAEAIKIGATNDAKLFELIEKSEDLEKDLEQIIYMALVNKGKVVESDPTEKGLRKVLNFGHTIGHGIEALNEGKLMHGECVALGMMYMSENPAKGRIKALLEKYNIETELKQSADEIMPFVLHDKKMKKDHITVVYVKEIGSFEFIDMSPEQIRNCME